LGRAGTLDDNPALRQAVQAVKAKGVAVVVSAGNDAGLEVSQQVPAGYPEVMAVASTTAVTGSNDRCKFFAGTIGADSASYFTTDGAFNAATGIGVTVSAPGEERENVGPSCSVQSLGILSARLGGGTTRLSGTSMASPHVTRILDPVAAEGRRRVREALAVHVDGGAESLGLENDRGLLLERVGERELPAREPARPRRRPRPVALEVIEVRRRLLVAGGRPHTE